MPRLLHAPITAGLLAVLGGCTSGDAGVSIDDCGQICGDGPLYMIDQLGFIIADDAGIDGFDLDSSTDDCGIPDPAAPDGTTGIDNQFGSVWTTLPDTVSTVLPAAIGDSLADGTLMVTMELVGQPNIYAEGPAALVFRQGDGDVLTSPDGRPLGGQTIALDSGDNLLGQSPNATVANGELHATDMDLILRVAFLDTHVELLVTRGMARMTDDGQGGLDLKLGGVVPEAAVMEIVTGLGGSADVNIRAALEAIVPLLIDVRTDPNGPCDGISGAFWGHAVPVHLYSDGS